MRRVTIDSGAVYESPQYYEIAFSFRDIAREIDTFEESIRRFSRIPVRRMLEIACGPCAHLPEIVRRGYEFVGIDLSRPMLDYARAKVPCRCGQVELLEADLRGFSLKQAVDFAFVLLGSLMVRSESELASHFDSVAASLRPGGLYFLDWCVNFEPPGGPSSTWDIERDGVRTTTTYSSRMINAVDQTFEEIIRIDVDDHGTCQTLADTRVRKATYPQEFLQFVTHRPDFEFVGWWNLWDLDRPLTGEEPPSRPIIVLRRLG